MALVIGIRFKRQGKVYYFDPGELTFTDGDGAIVETVRGVEYGEVAMLPREVADEEIVTPLKTVIRVATEEDKRRVIQNEAAEKEALAVGNQRIAEHGLEMKLVDVEYTFDGKKVVFYFTADGRVDFRDLVRDLAARFHTRIELRQIGVRDEAKMLGGIGPCGRPICCKSFMSDFVPVSIRMAKDQGISLNPTKISGLCGRLMCCLQFENDTYVKMRKELPKQGADVITADGPGEIAELEILQGKVRVRVTLPDMSCDVREYTPDEIRVVSRDEKEEAIRLLAENAPAPQVPRLPRTPRPRPQEKTEPEAKSAEPTAAEERPAETKPRESRRNGDGKPREAKKTSVQKVHMWPPRDVEITVTEDSAESAEPAEEKEARPERGDRPRRRGHRGGERHRNDDRKPAEDRRPEGGEKEAAAPAGAEGASQEKKSGRSHRGHRGSGHRRGGQNRGPEGGGSDNHPENPA